MRTHKAFLLLLTLIVASSLPAQQFNLPQNKNAALRYWIAFAEMQDRTVDEATTKLMEDVLSGAASWDEQRLNPILDANHDAIRTMQKGTLLPECNWGLDYDRGAAMSLAHLPKARAMARLNALYGSRQLAQGDAEGAVNTWLAGLRFAQHITRDMSLIGVLSAKPAFMANLSLLSKAVTDGRLNSDLLRNVKAQVGALPADGLNWSMAVKFEAWADEQALHYLSEGDFQQKYKTFFSHTPAPATSAPSESDIAAYRALMKDVIAAFDLPYDQAKARLQQLDAGKKSLHAAVGEILPNYPLLNERRHQVAQALQSLEQALADHGAR
jgi:hypothetical protein